MKKIRKPHNRKRPARQLPETKQRKNPSDKKDERPARTQWLQILSEEIEEDQAQDAGGNSRPERNGRRATPGMNLYVVERKSESVRRFR
jgi:hypothetical protein